MAKLLFVILFLSTQASAQIFSNPFSGSGAGETGLDGLIGSLKKLSSEDSDFEEKFRQTTLEIERQLDILRSDCQEKGGDASSRQRCFRDVVTRQKKYLENSYEAKKSLLLVVHKRQLTQLDESREQALKELDKQF